MRLLTNGVCAQALPSGTRVKLIGTVIEGRYDSISNGITGNTIVSRGNDHKIRLDDGTSKTLKREKWMVSPPVWSEEAAAPAPHQSLALATPFVEVASPTCRASANGAADDVPQHSMGSLDSPETCKEHPPMDQTLAELRTQLLQMKLQVDDAKKNALAEGERADDAQREHASLRTQMERSRHQLSDSKGEHNMPARLQSACGTIGLTYARLHAVTFSTGGDGAGESFRSTGATGCFECRGDGAEGPAGRFPGKHTPVQM